MKWSLIELQKYRNEPLLFSETVELKKSLMERDSEILDVSPIKIDGTLIVEKEEVIAHLVISLGLTMPSARSLKPVLVPMLIEANEIYVPKNVSVDLPLQAYFRINAADMGQFERTLIIADEGSFVHYIEGCTAPIYSTDSLQIIMLLL